MPKKARKAKKAKVTKRKTKVRKVRKVKKVRKVRKVKKVVKKMKKVKKVKAKKVAKKPTKAKAKKVAAKKALVRKVAEKVIGKVTHYYDRIGVAVVSVKKPIRLGDKIRLKHGKREFKQKVVSMQMNHTPIQMANIGQEVGMKVDQIAAEGTLLLAA